MWPNLFDKFKLLFTFPVDIRYRDTVEREVLDECYPTQRIVGWVILIFQAIMMVSALLRGGAFQFPRRTVYFILYVVLFFATLLFGLGARYLRLRHPEKIRFYLNMTATYALLVSLWSSTISVLDQYRSGTGLGVFTYVNMSIAVFIVMRPWQSVLVFGTSCLYLNTMVIAVQKNPFFYLQEPQIFGTVINSVFMTVMAMFVAINFGHYRVKRHFDRQLIEEQYNEICIINERLNLLAMTDQLTQMGNRRFLDEELNNLRREGVHTLTGMMLDIDFFKQFNDRYGHQAGDACLQEISTAILGFAGRENAFAIRYGGEEFFLCLRSGADAREKAETLRKLVEECFVARDDQPCGHVTVSIGVAVEEDWIAVGQDEFLRRCDLALYRAKNDGRNKVVLYQPHMAQGVSCRLP